MQTPLAPEIIMEQALEITDLQQRAHFLDDACCGNLELRNEMDSLITAHLMDETFMNSSTNPLWNEIRKESEGDKIGRYQLKKKIGEGGFGTVFLAEQSQPVKRLVALKVIKPGMDSQEVIARFEAERQALAMMNHPHIAKVHDAGTTDAGRPYFVMEWVNGMPITQYCAECHLDTRARLELFTDICAAIQHAHQKGIIHRDVKPSNILVSSHDGKPMVKVIDFGIAKAMGMQLSENSIFTQQDRMIGTPQYMSPEQAERHPLAMDTRSDIYSLGVILYELLTGTTPLDVKHLRNVNYGEMQRLIREVTPPKPSSKLSEMLNSKATSGVSLRSIRGDLDWIVLKALEKNPARRYDSAGAMAEDIFRFLQHKPVEARSPSMFYLMMRFARRYRGPVVTGTVLLLALILGSVGTSIGMKRALDAKSALEEQKLELVDYKERLSGLLESNQKMLGEISKRNIGETSLPTDFDEIRKENQALLDKVRSEVVNQERYTEEIEKLQQTKAQLEKNAENQRQQNAAMKSASKQLQAQLNGLQKSIALVSGQALHQSTTAKPIMPLDRSTGKIKSPHTLITLAPAQIEETQTLGTLTLTDEQWRVVREKSPQCPKRIQHILFTALPDENFSIAEDYIIELSSDRIAVIHKSDANKNLESLRDEIFRQPIISLRSNERGEFHLHGKLIPFPTLLNAFAFPPKDAKLDEEGKLIFVTSKIKKATTVQFWLGVKLPSGSLPTDPVYQYRLKQLADAAEKIGLRHGLFAK
jgi:serine/threonine protein kinase